MHSGLGATLILMHFTTLRWQKMHDTNAETSLIFNFLEMPQVLPLNTEVTVYRFYA